MRKVLPVLGFVLLMTSTAMAAEPLNDSQMDGVTAGFEVFSGPPPPPGTPPLTSTVVYVSFFPSAPTRFPTGLGSLQVVGISGLLPQLF